MGKRCDASQTTRENPPEVERRSLSGRWHREGLGVRTPAEAQKKLLFLPTLLTDGIKPSDDPLIALRSTAYSLSFSRRTSAP